MPAAFGDGKPQEVIVPPGTITVMVKRVRDGFLTAGQSATLSDCTDWRLPPTRTLRLAVRTELDMVGRLR